MKFKELREKYKSKYPAALVAAAVKIAIDMGGAMTPAVKKIEAMKRGLSDDPIVKDALRQANESVKEETIEERMSLDKLKKKFKKDIDNFNKRNKDLPQNVEKALQMFAIKNGEIETDDPDEFDEWLMQNIEEAKAPKAKGLNIYGSEISGLKDKKGRPHTVKPIADKGKLAFRVVDEFGSFKTVDLKTFAKEFG
jgi:hypothetical protein